MSISKNLQDIYKTIPNSVSLIAVSKTKPQVDILEAYHAGQKIFGGLGATAIASPYLAKAFGKGPEEIVEEVDEDYITPYMAYMMSRNQDPYMNYLPPEASAQSGYYNTQNVANGGRIGYAGGMLVEDEEDIPHEKHWNNMFDEDLGTSGTAWQTLEEIAIVIYPVPKRTKILGQKRVKPETEAVYNLPDDYDTEHNFTYQWELIGNAEFISNGTNFIQDGKSVDIRFLERGTVTIKVKISNDAGCFRYIIRNIFVGEVTRKMLVVRYPYF